MNHDSQSQVLALGNYAPLVHMRLHRWEEEGFGRRLWAKDPTLWFADPQPELTDRLGWLTLHETMRSKLAALRALADDIKNEGFRHVVLLGMGGSSLAPEVYQRTFGNAPGYPELLVLDSTHPDAVRAVRDRIDPAKTLFVVSSKSGGTLETMSGFRYFWAAVADVASVPGGHFVAVTDAVSSLETLATDRDFRAVFQAPSDVGGRYSALTDFGLVPASIIGVDPGRLLDRVATIAAATGPSVAAPDNPALQVGAAMGELALVGRDKVTYVVSPTLAAFPDWVEQLIAESTGKDDKGIVPIAGEELRTPEAYGLDRFFVYLSLDGEQDDAQAAALQELQAVGHPVVRIRLEDTYDLAVEMFRAEMAVAAAGAVLGIHPFNQPDVQDAKTLAKEAMEGTGRQGEPPAEVATADVEGLADQARAWLSTVEPGDYLAIQAYLPMDSSVGVVLHSIRQDLQRRFRMATTVGYGPRFLHSTGQLHKGGPASGLFLQIVDQPDLDLAVPETDYTFGRLIAAQSVGDYQAMRQRNRRVLRVNLGSNRTNGLAALQAALGG
ncbi:MAG: glucose-6-phosphate isomerase [Acidimicrobiia bacterium]|nr:glucose-6-phosphate isomerase [Acidimicrobiia bacterium]